MSVTATKVTHLGSQCSTSDAPTVPNATPATEALDNEIVNPPPPMDYAAVARTLGHLQESLNESAEEAMYPSPPINTPEILSPAPSIVYRLQKTRGRGFSAIGARLAQLKLDDRRSHRSSDCASCGSPEPSNAEEDGGADDIEVMSNKSDEAVNVGTSENPGSSSKTGLIPIVLGSPRINPRLEDYLSFTSKDLPAQAKICSPSNAIKDGDSVESVAGVTEKSNWGEELEDQVIRTCQRLEQLAQDEHAADSSRSVDDYYKDRIARLLGDRKRLCPLTVEKSNVVKDQGMSS